MIIRKSFFTLGMVLSFFIGGVVASAVISYKTNSGSLSFVNKILVLINSYKNSK